MVVDFLRFNTWNTLQSITLFVFWFFNLCFLPSMLVDRLSQSHKTKNKIPTKYNKLNHLFWALYQFIDYWSMREYGSNQTAWGFFWLLSFYLITLLRRLLIEIYTQSGLQKCRVSSTMETRRIKLARLSLQWCPMSHHVTTSIISSRLFMSYMILRNDSWCLSRAEHIERNKRSRAIYKYTF